MCYFFSCGLHTGQNHFEIPKIICIPSSVRTKTEEQIPLSNEICKPCKSMYTTSLFIWIWASHYFQRGGLEPKENIFLITEFSSESLPDHQMTNVQKKGLAFGCVVFMLSECFVFSCLWYLCSHTLSNHLKVRGTHHGTSSLNASACLP